MTTYSLQLSCLFVSSGLPVGLHFFFSFFSRTFRLISMVFAAPCQLTVKKTARSSVQQQLVTAVAQAPTSVPSMPVKLLSICLFPNLLK
jgi:hypothetical protein